jgi:hypothetical protein
MQFIASGASAAPSSQCLKRASCIGIRYNYSETWNLRILSCRMISWRWLTSVLPRRFRLLENWRELLSGHLFICPLRFSRNSRIAPSVIFGVLELYFINWWSGSILGLLEAYLTCIESLSIRPKYSCPQKSLLLNRQSNFLTSACR